jgi:hypothetical protein
VLAEIAAGLVVFVTGLALVTAALWSYRHFHGESRPTSERQSEIAGDIDRALVELQSYAYFHGESGPPPERSIEIASDIAILESSLRPNLPWPPENWEEILDEFLYRYPNDWHENSHRLLHRSNLQTLSESSDSRQVACECMDYTSSGGLAGPCQCGHSIQDHAAGICTIVTYVARLG